MSGTEIALIVGGVAAVGVVGYLIYKSAQPAAAATSSTTTPQGQLVYDPNNPTYSGPYLGPNPIYDPNTPALPASSSQPIGA